jgi:hypothetical protein
MLTALSMGTALAHLLEMPAKLGFDGQMWLFLLQKLYPPAFGTIGAVFEVGAVITVLVLLFLVRQRVPAFRWTLLGALCLIAAHAAFWFWVAPVNSAMLPLTSETLPADWTSLRNQWEYVHSTRAGLQIIALAALILSILAEIPAGSFRNVRRRVRVPF